jgi:hypothetical protein
VDGFKILLINVFYVIAVNEKNNFGTKNHNMDYIKSFTEQDLCKLIFETKESLYICLPLLQPEVFETINAIQSKHAGKVFIHIGIDFSPESFRQGYGEIESYKNVDSKNIVIRHLKDNRISFVISDDKGYFLFFESRYFIPADKPTYNAVSIDPISIIRLKQHFFQSYNSKSDYANEIANSFIEESERLKNIAVEFNNPPIIKPKEISAELCNSIEIDLEKNPPLRPDYKRIVDYYSNKFQYARLEIVGANLRSKKIDLPTKALPIKDADLKKQLEAKLNLFDKNTEAAFFEELESFNDYVAYIRTSYLTPLKCRKENVLNKLDKVNFDNSVNNLKEELKKVTSNKLMELANYIESTKTKLEFDLSDFFFQNKEVLFKNKPFLNLENDYVLHEAKNLAKETISKIRWPKAIELLDVFKINTYYSDITFEDLKNKELVNELIDKGLINSYDINNLTQLGKGIDVK